MSDRTPFSSGLDLTLDRDLGERLGLDAYRSDFQRYKEAITGRAGWKFERRQHFQELNSPSWEAFRRGDYDEALRLAVKRGEHWREVAREDKERDSVFHRVRVVEEPLTPYLWWELHSLRVQAESGMPVRVVGAGALEPWEGRGMLPEVVTLGGDVLYEVVYTDAGLLDGCVRFTGPELVGRWERFIEHLYADGEDVMSYTDRCLGPRPASRTTEE
ncbi:DUF6879 family protein [Streptomyces daliensis]|uniref:DUF6879 domain-containing protein n=1 Tax=Streptomyces daliensis TaxID=299421 RepID=A0A8T4J2Q7_9ACTN|nr:hypothetical protein [Streptomyces daliensis]